MFVKCFSFFKKKIIYSDEEEEKKGKLKKEQDTRIKIIWYGFVVLFLCISKIFGSYKEEKRKTKETCCVSSILLYMYVNTSIDLLYDLPKTGFYYKH